MLKAATPGSYTFILRATREVPRRLQNPRAKRIGLRIPQHAVAQGLLAEVNEPLLSSTLLLPAMSCQLNDAQEIRTRLGAQRRTGPRRRGRAGSR
jgi:tRNA A37 threonylcarbamoyladenosine synthetase subunit TsaC/SUA5/YrdC